MGGGSGRKMKNDHSAVEDIVPGHGMPPDSPFDGGVSGGVQLTDSSRPLHLAEYVARTAIPQHLRSRSSMEPSSPSKEVIAYPMLSFEDNTPIGVLHMTSRRAAPEPQHCFTESDAKAAQILCETLTLYLNMVISPHSYTSMEKQSEAAALEGQAVLMDLIQEEPTSPLDLPWDHQVALEPTP
eukprot:Filipodium_phascolosomae@DN4922_c0_g1_i1.p1